MFNQILAFFAISTGAFSIPHNRSLDHVQQMPIERDGEINEQFRQEMLFSHNLDSSDTARFAEDIHDMFQRADTNMDDILTPQELKIQIQQNMKEHLEKSRKDSNAFFKLVDRDNDRSIVWEEFEPHFEKMHAADEKIPPTEDAQRVEDERMMFNRSDITRDGRLDEHEWHVFLHPEYSAQGLVDIVNDLIILYDTNDDNVITREEFIDGTPANDPNPENAKMEEAERERRLVEFDEEIDVNGDGKANFRELYEYVDPQNFRMAAKEVNDILMMADANGDGVLSVEELLDRDWLLVRSSLISARKSLHDEM